MPRVPRVPRSGRRVGRGALGDHGLVTGHPDIRFYTGVPLQYKSGEALGTLCVIDHKPRQLSQAQQLLLEALARQVSAMLESQITLSRLRKSENARRETEHLFQLTADDAPVMIWMRDVKGRIEYINRMGIALPAGLFGFSY